MADAPVDAVPSAFDDPGAGGADLAALLDAAGGGLDGMVGATRGDDVAVQPEGERYGA